MQDEAGGAFIDTNVLLYLLSSDARKAARAEALLSEGGHISVQVLNEIANVARRKMALSWGETRDLLDIVRGLLTVHPITEETHARGLALAERYGVSVCDAMILAAARIAGCRTVWSEDMQDGMVVGEGLRVDNPFR
jgi:predicted nucleic acid-binding protein